MTSIIDNRDDNTLLTALRTMTGGGRDISIATAFFSLDALWLLSDTLSGYEKVRILFGDDSSATERRRLLAKLRETSDRDLLAQRETSPTLAPLREVEQLFRDGRIEARCYTPRKFHAKAYLVHRPTNEPPELGIIGSGNFTRPGLTQNLELNVKLYQEQTASLRAWFEERWSEAAEDVVTDDVLKEIRRQIDLYNPYVIYLKALYAWGAQQQAELGPLTRTSLQDALDAHQEQGYLRALKIIERENGVMICDGVGLGKSFIALALMEHYCRQKQNVLLIAPKSILSSSWTGYLDAYLRRYRQPYGTLAEIAMTELGYDPEASEADSDSLRKRREDVKLYGERADVIVIDESHNFRTTSADRYRNLLQLISAAEEGLDASAKRKKVVLLTATPINTAYQDIGNQLHLVTQGAGNIGGYSADQIRQNCRTLDAAAAAAAKNKSQHNAANVEQLSLDILETPSSLLNSVLENVVIQRSRATCRALAQETGKTLVFPARCGPTVIGVEIGRDSSHYRDLIRIAQERFEPGVIFFKEMEAAVKKSAETGKPLLPISVRKGVKSGIKLAAFLTEQYRNPGVAAPAGRKTYQDEVHLAKLVFTNTLKQLESSLPAFQSILQSLGLGLIARLRHVFPDDPSVLQVIAGHERWIRTRLFPLAAPSGSLAEAELEMDFFTEPEPDLEDDGDALDANGDESDAWLSQAVRSRQLQKKLTGFNGDSYDIHRWKSDIVQDLGFLQEIHQATLRAREQPDPKMASVLPRIKALIGHGKRVLLFTQSQRTAEYLERELRRRIEGAQVARIDSRVEKTRAAILHAFSPGYNARALNQSSAPQRIDILICTDVLSEGVNLQEAGAVVSWDIHWNPVRLIQRIGRVDRRLNLAVTPETHEFEILNVTPAEEIEEIIQLVGTLENRTLRISRALGLDQAFFSSDDPAGNLKEFNALEEGKHTPTERARSSYAHLLHEPPDERTRQILEATPPGAFAIWDNAPHDGLFALFTLEAKPSAPQSDLDRFSALIGQPVLLLESELPNRPPLADAGQILGILKGTELNQSARSGSPSNEADLKTRLGRLKRHARSRFEDINLPQTIVLKLVCWMELRAARS